MLEKLVEQLDSIDPSMLELPKVEVLTEEDIEKIQNTKKVKTKLCCYCGKYMFNFKEIFIWHDTKKDFLPGRYCSYDHAKAFIIECVEDALFEDYLDQKIHLIKADYLNDLQIDILNERITSGKKRQYRRTRTTYQGTE